MSAAQTTGLGEPQATGKKSLFQPPKKSSSEAMEIVDELTLKSGDKKKAVKQSSEKIQELPRVRSTIELTTKALTIIHDRQHSYRLKSGRVLPLWKVISDIIEKYGQKDGA